MFTFCTDVGCDRAWLLRDVMDFRYSPQFLTERVQKIKEIQDEGILYPVKPWMLRCKNEVLERFVVNINFCGSYLSHIYFHFFLHGIAFLTSSHLTVLTVFVILYHFIFLHLLLQILCWLDSFPLFLCVFIPSQISLFTTFTFSFFRDALFLISLMFVLLNSIFQKFHTFVFILLLCLPIWCTYYYRCHFFVKDLYSPLCLLSPFLACALTRLPFVTVTVKV